jgi:hypothetical protein
VWFTAPFFTLIAIELYLFGGVIPHAAEVKSIAYGFPITQSVFNVLSFGAGKIGFLFGILLFLTFSIKISSIIRIRQLTFNEVFLTFSFGIFFAWIIGRSLIFPWYYCLLVFPFGIATIIETQPTTRCFDDDGRLNATYDRMLRLSKLIIVFGFGILGFKAILPTFEFHGSEQSSLRVVRYLDIGSGLYEYCPSCKLATSEIGGLGYSFKGRVYDAFGLGDPYAIKFHPMKVPEERQGYGIGAIPPNYVKYRNPDFIVSMPIFSMALRSSKIINNYHSYDCPFGNDGGSVVFGDTKIQIFSKNVLPNYLLLKMKCEITIDPAS